MDEEDKGYPDNVIRIEQLTQLLIEMPHVMRPLNLQMTGTAESKTLKNTGKRSMPMLVMW